MVWIRLHLLDKGSYNREVTLSSGVEYWCLSIAIHVVRFTALLKKEF